MPPYQSFYNSPYYNQQMQPQMMQQTFNQPVGLSGRFINDANEISVNDVPMSGRFSVFPKSDMSEIICKTWTPNGTIQTITFKPLQEAREATLSTDANNYPYAELKSALEALSERVGILESNSKPKKVKNDE